MLPAGSHAIAKGTFTTASSPRPQARDKWCQGLDGGGVDVTIYDKGLDFGLVRRPLSGRRRVVSWCRAGMLLRAFRGAGMWPVRAPACQRTLGPAAFVGPVGSPPGHAARQRRTDLPSGAVAFDLL